MSEQGLFCSSCRFDVQSEQDRITHYKSNWHRYNVKRKVNGLPAVTLEVFSAKLEAISSVDSSESTKKSQINPKKSSKNSEEFNYSCTLCKALFHSKGALATHLKSNKHKKAADLAAITAQKLDESSISEDPIRLLPKNREEKAEHPELVIEKSPIPLGDCLFCKAKFGGDIDQCVEHMSNSHGFQLPFKDALVDRDGLLEYLGAKLGIGHVCLWCNGKKNSIFHSLESVRLHMLDKGHCTILWNDDDDDFEFDEFYEFPELSSERKIVGINHLGELMLNDGSLIGSRDLQLYYRQRVHVESESDRIAKTMLESRYESHGSCGALILPSALELRQTKFRRRAVEISNRQQMKSSVNLGVKSNRLQRYIRDQTGF